MFITDRRKTYFYDFPVFYVINMQIWVETVDELTDVLCKATILFMDGGFCLVKLPTSILCMCMFKHEFKRICTYFRSHILAKSRCACAFEGILILSAHIAKICVFQGTCVYEYCSYVRI